MDERLIEIARFDPAEADQLGRVFFDAVREGAASFYDDAQRRAWASSVPAGPDWAARLAIPQTAVARNAGRPIGFMTLAQSGYIDLAFVDPAYQRQGVGRLLYDQIERWAREARVTRLTSDASHLAKGLFEQQGWTVVQEQQIERHGVTLTNFAMAKRLGDFA